MGRRIHKLASQAPYYNPTENKNELSFHMPPFLNSNNTFIALGVRHMVPLLQSITYLVYLLDL